ncbi:DUF481 domain-containing protein [Glaciecola sp. 1036]|uniref:DUF481 domain-containing protein n=1 Tax=Alteromonadaceae TaxID=72275 RepID=UPI003D04B3D5
MAEEVALAYQQKAYEFFRNAHQKKRNLLKILEAKKQKESEKALVLDGEFGFLKTTGNTDTSVFMLAFDSSHKMEKWISQYYLQILNQSGDVSGVSSDTSRVQVSGEFDYKPIKGKNRLFLYAEYDDNEFLQLRDQFTAVVGWRHILWEEKKSSFNYSVGPGYATYRQEDDNVNEEGPIVRGTANFVYEFENEARFKQNLSAEISDTNNRATAISSLSAKVFERLAMKFSFEMTVDENVGDNVDQFTTRTSVSLVYQFF